MIIDQIIVLAYLLIVLIIGLLSGRDTASLEDYAVGKRNFSNPVLVAGIAATLIAASGTSGLAGKVCAIGIITVIAHFGAAAQRFLIAFLIAPRMKKFLGLISSGDIFEKLYGRKAKILIGFLTFIEGPLLAGAQILAMSQAGQIFFGLSKEMAAVITTIITVAYCLRGGIRSVTATDVFQFIIMMIAIPTVALVAVGKIGGFKPFIDILNEKHLLFDSVINGDQFKYTVVFLSLALTCVFPLTIQRMLMAKNVEQIKKTFFTTGLISVFYYVAIGIIGLSAAILLPDINPNFALPALIEEILPIGIRGLVIAGLIAIFMSSSDSDMNITSIALTQDLLNPLFGSRLTQRMAFILTRIGFVFSGILATVIALYYSNALDVLFLIMVIANSVYFPGMFFGILGAVPSKRSFWIGAFLGALIAGIMCIGFKVFPLYSMMTAISVNSSIILASFLKSWVKKSNYVDLYKLRLSSVFARNKTFTQFKKSDYLVSFSSYCDIFSTLIIISTMATILLWTIFNYQQTKLQFALNIIASVASILVLLRQLFNTHFTWAFPVIWHLSILFGLTLNVAINIVQNNFNTILMFDVLVTFAILVIVLDKNELVLHVILFFCLAPLFYTLNKPNLNEVNNFYYWLVFLRSSALILCLILFRKREVAAYRFMSLKFVHEAGRTMSSVSTSAALLDLYLPKLVQGYRSNITENSAELSENDLNKILEIPSKLINTSNRTWQNLNRMASWMEIDEDKTDYSMHSIKSALKLAIDDSSLSESIKNRLRIKEMDDFLFYGDNMQISNVILNILENAGHATKDIPNSEISIWTQNSNLFIRDSGIGISKKDLPNIFDEFFSTKGSSGQGLAFCRLVMQQHQGSISCDSKIGKYTEFKLSFPLNHTR